MAYYLPTKIIFGEGSLDQLPDVIRESRCIALFASKRTLKTLDDRLKKIFAGKDVHTCDHISPEPPPKELFAATAWLRSLKSDVVVAIGGGSVMDLAKAAAALATQQQLTEDMMTALPDTPVPAVRTICVPTTAGTGSEVTPFTVFWDHESKKKYSFGHDLLYPETAIVDPELTYSMPPDVTATTGMDAFTQACEAFWNVNHNPTSDGLMLEAVKLIEHALPKSVKDGADRTARHDMMLGSLRAGQAFSNTRTAACHSISYPMTLHYGVTHGQAVGITLPEVLLLDTEAVPPERTAEFLRGVGATTMEEFSERVRAMMKAAGLKTRLHELGIDEPGIELIVNEGFTAGRMGNNPYVFTAETLRNMLKRIA